MDSKYCLYCNSLFFKNNNESKKYFSVKKYCSKKCSGKSKIKPKKIKVDKITDGYCTREYTHPIYDAWRNMKRRCYYKSNEKTYKNYGGRGIEVCDEWKNSFETFLTWALNNNWEKGLTIDRIDNDGNYCPENCQWITQKQQLANRRISLNLTYEGVTKSASEWAEYCGMSYSGFLKRLKKWNDITRIIEEPLHTENQRFQK